MKPAALFLILTLAPVVGYILPRLSRLAAAFSAMENSLNP